MSACCNDYPICKHNHPDFNEEQLDKVRKGHSIFKTNGQSQEIMVPNPDRFYEGRMRKVRSKATNITPRKKKRK